MTALPSPGLLSVDEHSNHLLDSRGRIRLFHGVNLVCKTPPWYWPQLLEDSYARDLASWGLNIVRLGVIWSGLEPEEGRYDVQYIAKLRTIIRNFGKHGVSVVLDIHQDVASSWFGTYDGFPPWLVDKLRNPAVRAFPWPLESVTSWFLGYVTKEVCCFYQDLYTNKEGAGASLATAWSTLASTLGMESAVIGYDILNEPWTGDAFKDGALLLPGHAGHRLLAPLYTRIHAAIREVDRDKLVLWEAVTWTHWLPDPRPSLAAAAAALLRRYPLLSWLRLLSWLGILKLAPDLEEKEEIVTPRTEDNQRNSVEKSKKQTGKLISGLRSRKVGEEVRDKEKEIPESNNLNTLEAENVEDEVEPTSENIPAFGTGFLEVPGGEEWRHKSVLSWHYYYPPLTYDTRSFPWWHRLLAHRLFGPGVFRRTEAEAGRLGAGQILTEWGIAIPDRTKPDSWGSVEAAWVMDRPAQPLLVLLGHRGPGSALGPGVPCSWCCGGPLPALPPGRGGHHPLLPVHPRHGGAHHGVDRQGRGGEEQPGLPPLPPLHQQLQHHHQPGGGVVDASRESKGAGAKGKLGGICGSLLVVC